jgi:hypothetical protein
MILVKIIRGFVLIRIGINKTCSELAQKVPLPNITWVNINIGYDRE